MWTLGRPHLALLQRPSLTRPLHRSITKKSGGAASAALHVVESRSRLPVDVPSLKQFMLPQRNSPLPAPGSEFDSPIHAVIGNADDDSSLLSSALPGRGSFYLETFGCQMNELDSEILVSILSSAGYVRTDALDAADVVLTNTCAIRDAAEVKVWSRLGALSSLRKRRALAGESGPVIGVLGCMAERLKGQLLEKSGVHIVAGPDAYRDLPRLIEAVRTGGEAHAMNVQLSVDETYADITPVRPLHNRVSAFVSIMRGCSNMCSFCVVPFTRGRERSRDVTSISDEVSRLADEGYREVTLLGQNVNSYRDLSTPAAEPYASRGYVTSSDFGNMYRARGGGGTRFTELLDVLSRRCPDMRLRFTSPHPKDFPDDLLHLMAERDNICKHVHLPAQSGSTRVLSAMRRMYTRDAYLTLAHRIRALVPGVALSSDFISGFCGETEEDHADTLSLMREVRFENAFMFAYSKRERTHAAYKLEDDVPPDVKLRRLHEVIGEFRRGAALAHAEDVGSVQEVLLEGASKRSTPQAPLLAGRTSSNKRCIVAVSSPAAGSESGLSLAALSPGRIVKVRIVSSGVTSLRGEAVV